jgi:hypothetical protein
VYEKTSRTFESQEIKLVGSSFESSIDILVLKEEGTRSSHHGKHDDLVSLSEYASSCISLCVPRVRVPINHILLSYSTRNVMLESDVNYHRVDANWCQEKQLRGTAIDNRAVFRLCRGCLVLPPRDQCGC